MKIVKAYNSVSLVLRIVIGMVIGAALALIIPNAAETAPGIGILGTLIEKGMEKTEIARTLGRTVRAVNARLKRLGIDDSAGNDPQKQ